MSTSVERNPLQREDELRRALGLAPRHFIVPDVVSPQECADLTRWAKTQDSIHDRTAVHPTFTLVPEDLRGPVVQRVQQVLRDCNRAWRLPQTAWHVTVSSYTRGNYFPEHRDHDPSFPDYAPGITFAASVLLSGPSDFEGGSVTVDGRQVPKGRGTAACFHAFSPHSVSRVTGGERVALNVFATLGTLGEAKRVGWPSQWLYASDEHATAPPTVIR